MLKIVTHSGQAHADDLMAIALILIKENYAPKEATILRVNECKVEDYPDANFIVDIGKHYDASKGWFDHHQFAVDAPADCAFTLVAAHYGLGRDQLSWIERLAILDSKGPWTWFENQFGRPATGMEEINEALTTFDVFSWFCHEANRSYEDPFAFTGALELAVRWLKAELKHLENRKANRAFAESNLQLIDMGHFKIAFFKTKELRGSNGVADDLHAKDEDVVIVARLDDRSDGFSAMRLSNSERVNFLPRKGEPNCIFAHENGFCLKWKNDWDSFLDAIKRSVEHPDQGGSDGKERRDQKTAAQSRVAQV